MIKKCIVYSFFKRTTAVFICHESDKALEHWNRFPREAVDASSLKVFEARLDGALIYWVEILLELDASSN